MPSAAANTLFSIIGWSLLPSTATDFLLRFIVVPYLHIPPTPLARRITYAVVVFSYLIYNFVEAAASMPPNYYDWLGVPLDVDEAGLKIAFRAFARRFHPDRVGTQGTMLFTVVREGYEALMDPAKRWAYDRFGPEILVECPHCVTPRDYLTRGLIQSLGFHIGSGIFLIFFTAIGQKSSVVYWRYTLFFALAAAEIALLFAPSPSMRTVYDRGSNILAMIFSTRLPYQHIRFLHQVFVFLSVGLSRVVPVLFPGNREDASNGLTPAQASDILMRAKTIDAEAFAIVQAEMLAIQPIDSSASTRSTPLSSPQKLQSGRARAVAVPEANTLDILTREMERLVIEARIKTEHVESELGRARREVVNRAKEDFARTRPWRRRMMSSGASFSFGGGGGGRGQTEVIDVDALDDGAKKVVGEEEGRKVTVNEVWGNLALPLPPQVREKSPTLVRRRSMPGEFYRARSQSC